LLSFKINYSALFGFVVWAPDFVDLGRADKEFVLVLFRFEALCSLRPVVANRVGKHTRIICLIGCNNWEREYWRISILCAGVFIPADIDSIASVAVESLVLFIEGKAIHRVHVSLIFVYTFFPVALETKRFVISLVR
jgi:hypothetical protein